MKHKSKKRSRKSKNINVLTYNVSRQSIEGINKGTANMAKCWSRFKNICAENISKWLAIDATKQFKIDIFDFIALQEINYENERQWSKNIFTKILKYKPNFFDKYDVIGYTNDDYDGCITMFDKTKYNYISHTGISLNIKKKGRPALIIHLENQISGKRIYIINGHFPHYNQDKSFEILKKELIDIDADIVLCADFNYIPSETDIKNLSEKIRYNDAPMKMTCCDVEGLNKNYLYASDHIFSTLKLKTYKLGDVSVYSDTNSGNSFTSDHLPVMSKFY